VGLANDCADACSGCAANDGSFQAATEKSAEDRAATSADEGTFSGPNAALTAIVSIVAVVVATIVVTAMSAISDTAIEVIVVVVLCSCSQAGCKQDRRNQT
jgi:hypothetical protein